MSSNSSVISLTFKCQEELEEPDLHNLSFDQGKGDTLIENPTKSAAGEG